MRAAQMHTQAAHGRNNSAPNWLWPAGLEASQNCPAGLARCLLLFAVHYSTKLDRQWALLSGPETADRAVPRLNKVR